MNSIGYDFKNQGLLDIALTHSSYNEKAKKINFERLEFLGDRVLGIIISEKVFKKFESENEGQLAKRFSYLVCKKTLCEVAKDINIHNFIKISSDIKENSIQSIVANSLEAIIASIFLDSDYKTTKAIVLQLWKKYFLRHKFPPLDPKSKLQDWCLKKKKKLPDYILVKKVGPDHNPTFTVKVMISSKIFSSANGKNKQDAEINAAKKLIEKIGAN